MATSELKAVAPQTIHRFFELMVPSRTSSAIFLYLLTAAQRARGSDGTRECVVEAGLGKGTFVSLCVAARASSFPASGPWPPATDRTLGCFRHSRVSTMAPIFRRATKTFGLLN
jgi:hypothetical protein